MYDSLAEAVELAEAQQISLGELALRTEASDGLKTRAEIESALKRALDVMRHAVARGLPGDLKSVSGLVGGDAAKMTRAAGPLAGTVFTDVIASALAVQEVNAASVLPGVLLGLARHRSVTDDQLIRALATAGLVGAVVAVRASLSGAEGGCQAETGAAAGMAAAAGVELLGGSPTEASHAVALTMQGTLGLVCDPLGGLVEVPCVYRNATGGAMALAGIEMALAGIRFPIPVDEVIDTMGEIGRTMDVRYRETAGGGLAATPTGRKLAKERLVQLKGKRPQ
jgi:L-serine dehydratase